jgi:fluoride exporter
MLATCLTAIFGALGVLSRYGIDRFVTQTYSANFPISTFSINTIGSFLIGVIFVIGTERTILSTEITLAISIGFIGGFTTFSAFSLQVLQLLEQKQTGLAAAYAFGSPALGIAAAFAGVSFGRIFGR